MDATKHLGTRVVWASIVTVLTAFVATGSVATAAEADDDESQDLAAVAVSETPTVKKRSRRRPTEEITVTARKTEENLKDVPLSITAFDSNMIEAAGITNLQDIADLTPGLTFFSALGENLPTPIIRGVAPTDIFGENNAAVFVDGIYISGRAGLNFSQLDVERIEVVKGPQSALYGRTAFSGAINYITKRPAHEFESRIDVEGGNRGKQKVSALVSGPLFTDALRGRVAALYDDFDGSYDNSEAPDNGISGRRFRSFQGSLVWDATDNLEFYGSIYTSNDEIDDPALLGISTNCENRLDEDTGDVRYQNFCGRIPDLEDAPSPGPGLVSHDSLPVIADATGENRDLFRANLNINWDFDFGTFTALGGYSETEQSSKTDFGHVGSNNVFLYCEGAAVEAPAVPNSCGQNPATNQLFAGVLNTNEPAGTDEEYSAEFRFTSSQDKAIRYTVGAYGFTSKSFGIQGKTGGILVQPKGGTNLTNHGLVVPADWGFPPFDPSAPNFAIGTAIFYCSLTPDGCGDPLQRKTGETTVDAFAFFGGLDWDLTDRLTARTELRYGEQTEEIQRNVYKLCDETGDPTGTCGDDWWDLSVPGAAPEDPNDPTNPNNSRSGSATFKEWTGRIGLDFRLNDSWMMYGSVATGTKPGGLQLFNLRVVTPTGTERERIDHTFDPEDLTAYELGLKGSTADGRLALDMAVFYLDWQDIVLRQIVEQSPVSGRDLEQPTAFNVNAGSADVFGWEMTADVGFTDDLSGRIGVSWTDASLTNAAQDTFESFPSFAPNGDVSGNKLLRQSEWTGSASLNYVRSLWSDWEGFGRVDVSFQDKYFLGNDNQSWVPSRTTANLRFGLESGRYTVAFWVRNLLDDGKPTAAFRDIFWSNSSSQTPPYDDLGPRPTFDKFVPLRYTVTYPSLRTYGVTATVRFGGLAGG